MAWFKGKKYHRSGKTSALFHGTDAGVTTGAGGYGPWLPGGSRIISIILQNALNLIDHGMAPQEAIDAARIHYQGVPDRLYMEQRGLSPDTQKLLRARGYTLEEQTPWAQQKSLSAHHCQPLKRQPAPAMMPHSPA